MKLTIEQERQIKNHINYGVEIEILNYKCDYVGIKRAKTNGYYYYRNILHITYEGGSTGKSLNECRLIVHNLSDLTKKIEHNGEKFVPFVRLEKEFGYINVFRDKSRILETAPYSVIQRILSWHFNIFNLPENLWININTI